jgi:DNA-binding NtrC family response regulator
MEKHNVDMAFSGQTAIRFLDSQKDYQVVVTDLKMKGLDGLDVLRHAKNLVPAPEVILITAFASQQTAVEAMRIGAYDYLIKPFEIEELSLRINRILDQQKLRDENRRLRDEMRSYHAGNMIGKSEKMREVYKLIHKVADSETTVLILGESGTGKELVAEAIHQQSERVSAAFIAVNCAAVPETLLESELFGYEKGAFTGATGRKSGFFEMADKGTLFLDEIGDMPLGIQAKLLRVLQNKEIIRIGGREKVSIDARVICATNQNLDEMVRQGKFRSDLYYRINVFPIQLPPLRERKEDIPELIEYFLRQYENKSVTSDVKKMFIEYDWPGNIRELQNVLERAAIIADKTIDSKDLPADIGFNPPDSDAFDIPDQGINLDNVEKHFILRALEKSNGNKTMAAKLLGITRRRLYSMIDRYNI